MTTARSLIIAAALAGSAAPAAAADGPVAACPPPYTLFAIPTDGSRPVAAALDAAGNQDGYACELPYPGAAAAHVGSPYNVIENRIPLSS